MLIRRETVSDIAAVAAVTTAAFARPDQPDPVETTLLAWLREDAGWIPELSLVALDPSQAVIGHVVCSRGHVGDTPAPGLGPLSVHPDHQGRGVGTALMHAVLAAAEARDEPLVALLGEPAYYGRFGFRPSADHGIAAPDPAWGRHFQIRTLAAHPSGGLAGTYRYAEPFSRL